MDGAEEGIQLIGGMMGGGVWYMSQFQAEWTVDFYGLGTTGIHKLSQYTVNNIMV